MTECDHPREKQPLVIAMAGLPGTGKSAIATELARRLGATVLSKDEVRARLFGERTDFSREQDDLCMEVVYLIAEEMMKARPGLTIIIDGRTFSRSCQIERVFAWSTAINATICLIECVCDDETARQRLERDRRTGDHPAGNRTFKLYQELKAQAEPITAGRLVIDTSGEPIARSIERCIAWLERR